MQQITPLNTTQGSIVPNPTMLSYAQTCNELKVAKRYWKASVSLLNVNIPNSHVIPSNGNSTTADWTPDLSREKHMLITYSDDYIYSFWEAVL